jgi:3-oxoacyl-[acyl-carrier-protein] synthase-3
MQQQAAITGWGWYSPEQVMTNEDVARLADTTDAWVHTRTGIRERRIAGPNESTSTMGLSAARRALAEAQLDPLDLDLIICATTTPDHLLPASACLIQQRLGAERAGAFDLNTACSGFIYGLTVGNQFIQAGSARRVLVVASETLSRFVNWDDRSTCILFGDGAAAVVLESTSQPAGVLSTVLGSRGDVDGMLRIEAGGSARPASLETIAAGAHWVRMRGNEVFKVAVRCMAGAAQQALAKAGVDLRDIRAVVPHQANLRIINATRDLLGVRDDQMYVNIERHGNTGAASLPIALAEYLYRHPAAIGDHFLMVAFGGGLTWGAAVLRWADIGAVKRERQEDLRSKKMALTG